MLLQNNPKQMYIIRIKYMHIKLRLIFSLELTVITIWILKFVL